MVLFSGKSFRHGEKIRLHESVHKTNLEIRVTSRKVRLKSAKNLYLRYRFFDKIRQIHRFFYLFRQKLQILCRNQAHPSVHLARGGRALIACQLAPPAWRETRPLAALSYKKPGIHTKWIPGRNCLQPVYARGADLQRCCYRTRALLEVLDAALNQRLELVASSELRDVLVEARTGALRVAHLAQDAAIGAGNAFDS